jgi:hypothetical protein
MSRDLMTLGYLRKLLENYPDSYYIDFGDKWLTKVDDHDTDVLFCEWLDYDEVSDSENTD